MQIFSPAAFWLNYLVHALQSQTSFGLSEAGMGHHDEVSFVQQRMNYTTNLDLDFLLEQDASAGLGPQFRLEDAEALFNLGMHAVHHKSAGPTLEEKGIALLQSLAEHHSVAGTATQETLQQAALSLKSNLDEREMAESQTKVRHDWVEITEGSDGKPGICWNFFGGKPLQCEVERQMMPQDKGDYANVCEKACADYEWCSGYGYGKRTKNVPANVDNLVPNAPLVQTIEEDVCLLMSNGAEPCPHSWVTYGLVASVSARDFRVYPAGSDVGEPGSNFPYTCTAKHREPTPRVLTPNRFEFEQLAPLADKATGRTTQQEAFCIHVDDKKLHSCMIKLDDFWHVDPVGWKTKTTDAEITWYNKCEKICAGLDWCVGYSFYSGSRFTSYNTPECFLHSNLDSGCPEGKSWTIVQDPDALPAASIDDIKPDPLGAPAGVYGRMCRVKGASWRGKFQQMFRPGPKTLMCRVSTGVMMAQAAMALTTLLGNLECYRQSTTQGPALVPNPGATTTTPLVLDGGAPRMAEPSGNSSAPGGALDELTLDNVSRGFKNWSLSKKGRKALTQILSHVERTDLSGLKLSKDFSKAKCFLATNSAGMRWTLGTFANYFEKQYQCEEAGDPALKAKMFCRSALLRTVGRGLFGAGLYGFTAIKENCGDQPVEPTKFFCSLDYGKIVLYVGKMIFHVLQLAFFLNADEAWEKATTAVNVAGSFVFLGEAIVRTLGPCLGHMRNNEADTVIKDGTCFGTYIEELGLGVYTTSSAVQSYNYCVTKK